MVKFAFLKLRNIFHINKKSETDRYKNFFLSLFDSFSIFSARLTKYKRHLIFRINNFYYICYSCKNKKIKKQTKKEPPEGTFNYM